MTPEREEQIRETWKKAVLPSLPGNKEHIVLLRRTSPSVFDLPPEGDVSPCEDLVEAITYTIKRNTFRRIYTVTCEGITLETGYY